MATLNEQRKKRARLGFRYTMELNFASEDSKKSFLSRVESAKQRLAPRGSPPLESRELLSSLLDMAEATPPPATTCTGDQFRSQAVPTGSMTMLENSGFFVPGDEAQSLFVCERKTFEDLCAGFTQPCQCQASARKMIKTVQRGHVLCVEFQCQRCKQKQQWASSRTLGGRYLINQKIVHSFTCAGILPSQYIHFSTHANLGTLGPWYINSVYKSGGYLEAVNTCAKLSMMKAITEVKALPNYAASGEWVITDARHDSTSNAFHTTVPCLSGSTKRILGCATVSRKEHAIAQTRELEATKAVLPQVLEQDLKVVEVAHDNAATVKNYITEDLHLLNSYDTWHGTKNVAKSMRKISCGTKKTEGKSWFVELSDKCKSTKVHLYYCMKNCAQSPTKLRESILNIVSHYQNKHSQCHEESFCRRSGYSPTKLRLTDPAAIQAYEKALKATLIYKNAESYCRCRDTFWIESFNHQLLTYLPKRIHFGSTTFKMRMNLAIMDWNENVQRASTSERLVLDMRRPDRRTPMKVLVKKTFNFVGDIWRTYTSWKVTDLGEIDENDSDMDVGDEEDDLLADGEGIPDDDIMEVQPQQ